MRGFYEDIRDGLKRALLLNEKVEALDKAVNGLAQDLGSLATHVHELDKRLVRIETMADLSLTARSKLESKD